MADADPVGSEERPRLGGVAPFDAFGDVVLAALATVAAHGGYHTRMTATPNGHHQPEQSDVALARRVLAMVMDQSHECVQMLRTLLAASQSGDGATQAEVVWQLRDYGLEPEEIVLSTSTDALDRRAVAARRAGTGGGRSLLLWAHPDRPSFDGGAGWSVDPFAGEVRNGRIYGWGIADDLSGVAALLLLPRMLRILRAELAGDVVLASLPGSDDAGGVSALLGTDFAADAGMRLRPPKSGSGLDEIEAISPDAPLFRTVASAITSITDEPPHYTANEIHLPVVDARLQAVGIGPRAGNLSRAGERNEWMELDDYLRMIAVCTVTAIRWCGTSA